MHPTIMIALAREVERARQNERQKARGTVAGARRTRPWLTPRAAGERACADADACDQPKPTTFVAAGL